jgi:hypothetical protein
MTLRRKPKTADEFVSQGAAIPDPEPVVKEIEKLVKFETRMPVEIVELIEVDRKAEFPNQSRNSWLISAAVNELKRKGKL